MPHRSKLAKAVAEGGGQRISLQSRFGKKKMDAGLNSSGMTFRIVIRYRIYEAAYFTLYAFLYFFIISPTASSIAFFVAVPTMEASASRFSP